MATCNVSEENKIYTCDIENCQNSRNIETTTNVTCACSGRDEPQTGANCALELAGEKANACVLTVDSNTIPCKKGEEEECKIIKPVGTEPIKTLLQLECDRGKAEGAQNQGKKGEGAQNQGKKGEGAQNQGKKGEGAQNQGKKGEGAQNHGEPDDEKPVQHESAGVQNSERPGEVPSSESTTGASSASEGNAEQSAQQEKKEEGVSAAAHNSQEAAYLYPLLPFIAVMPRIN
ncbi:hypothetical protein TRVL_09842 [Trypanosoma vivax]|nr:hypothetical protein TRVL_09842 [Trypanosoma vivax]